VLIIKILAGKALLGLLQAGQDFLAHLLVTFR
jgi:hypothetical protein